MFEHSHSILVDVSSCTVLYIHLWFTAGTFTTCMCVVCTCVFYIVPLALQHLHHKKQVVLTTEYVGLMVADTLNSGHWLLLHYTVIIYYNLQIFKY